MSLTIFYYYFQNRITKPEDVKEIDEPITYKMSEYKTKLNELRFRVYENRF